MKRAVAVVGLLGVLVACAPIDADSSRPASSKPASNAAEAVQPQGPVIMYGDSLLEEASPYVRSSDEIRAFGGTALCDWVDAIATASVTEQPSMMVVEFVGNDVTPCMSGYDTPDEVRAKYLADAAELKRQVDTPILWVGPPLFRDGAPPTAGMFDDEPLFVDAGAALLADGDYADTLPCLVGEGSGRGCDGGQIAVRSPDGAHFCPDQRRAPCDVYSSGGRRFAEAIDDAVRSLR
jgi:hypothetical protein